METKKEVQEKIIKRSEEKVSDEEFYSILRLIAPGTNLRTALEGALKTQKGALIVIENENLLQLLDGGFRINTKFTPQKLIELTKMDGAIVLSKDLIRYAIELGKESTLLKIRLKEITKGVEKETDLVIKDYAQFALKRSKTLLEDLSYDEILENDRILEILGYEKSPTQPVTIKGWRLLSRTSLHESEIAALINEAGSLGKSLHSNLSFYSQILGYEKAQTFKEELSKIKMNHLTA